MGSMFLFLHQIWCQVTLFMCWEMHMFTKIMWNLSKLNWRIHPSLFQWVSDSLIIVPSTSAALVPTGIHIPFSLWSFWLHWQWNWVKDWTTRQGWSAASGLHTTAMMFPGSKYAHVLSYSADVVEICNAHVHCVPDLDLISLHNEICVLILNWLGLVCFCSQVLQIKSRHSNIDLFTANDFELIGYQPHKRITMKMAVWACRQTVQLWPLTCGMQFLVSTGTHTLYGHFRQVNAIWLKSLIISTVAAWLPTLTL